MDVSWRCLSCEEMSWFVESLSEPTFISECSVGKRDVTETFKSKSYAKYLNDRITRLDREHLYVM
jgi:hypothetical protein